jgi:nicotinate-nucleotide pyrophosphorylase (carboxylating)
MNYNNEFDVKNIIINALKEDIGFKDITTDTVIPKDKLVDAIILAKEDCVVCGLGVASCVLKEQDKDIQFKSLVKEGDFVKKGKILAKIHGRARSILTSERAALNFLSLLSGISTATRKFVDAVKPHKAKIIDTRKTIPGLRILEKYAVRIGGGFNHRMSLDEMILIKDNHLKVVGDRLWVVGFKKNFPQVKTEIEVKTLKEFNKALKLKPDIIMLDNMIVKDMKRAVLIRNSLSPNTYHLTPKLEASGGITLKNVKHVASSGVDMISIGALTHSVNSVDISLEII